MNIGIVQLDIEFEAKENNKKKVKKHIADAAERGVDILFFPEMTFTGFSMDVSKNADLNGSIIEEMKKLSSEYGVAVGFGWIKKTGERGENHYTVVSPDKEILSDYVKMHPFSYSNEDKYYNAGNSLAAFTYCGRRISTFICYDLRFPEIFQAVSQESEVIVVAANWPERRSDHWKTLLKARAIENQSWILGVNCYGDQQGMHYSGDSAIIRPDGTIAAQLNNSEGMLAAAISSEAEEARSSFPVKHDRRINLYKTFYK